VSPWSVSSALAVLAPGCDPAARKEPERALVGGSWDGGTSAGDDDIVAGLAADVATIAGERRWSGDSLLTLANTLWVDEGRTPLPAFTAALDRWPGAALRFAPIAADPEGTRRAVNADVAATTRNLIPEVLPDGTLTPQDRAVIANALDLFAPWLEPFAASRTEDAPFHGPGGTRAVPTMRAAHDLAYAPRGVGVRGTCPRPWVRRRGPAAARRRRRERAPRRGNAPSPATARTDPSGRRHAFISRAFGPSGRPC
jgi:serine protease inhibitor